MRLTIKDRQKVSRPLQITGYRLRIGRTIRRRHRAKAGVLDEPVKSAFKVRFGIQKVTHRVESIFMWIRSPGMLDCRWRNIQPRHRRAQLRKKPHIMTRSTSRNENTTARKTGLFHKFSKWRSRFTMIPGRVSRTPPIFPEIPDFVVYGLIHDKTVAPQRKSCQFN